MPQPAKSPELHALHGTTPQTPKTVASPIPAGRPKFPGNLAAELRPVFKKICRMLETRRALTEADGPLLALYCVSYARAQKANEKLAVEGEVCEYTRLDSNGQPHVVEKPNLWLKVAQDAEKQMVACLDRLGLSPMNRDKVKQTASSKEEQAANPMDAYMSRRPSVVRPVISFSKQEEANGPSGTTAVNHGTTGTGNQATAPSSEPGESRDEEVAEG